MMDFWAHNLPTEHGCTDPLIIIFFSTMTRLRFRQNAPVVACKLHYTWKRQRNAAGARVNEQQAFGAVSTINLADTISLLRIVGALTAPTAPSCDERFSVARRPTPAIIRIDAAFEVTTSDGRSSQS